jgi:hypothetical protein
METRIRTWKHGRGHGDMDEEMETWMRTWRHGNLETWRHEDLVMETWAWRHGHRGMGMETWTWRHGIKLFLGIQKFTKNQRGNGKWEAHASFFNRLLFVRHANGSLLFCPFIEEETNRSYPFAKGVNGLVYL